MFDAYVCAQIMPTCSQCGRDKERTAYTKVQLRKADGVRRCKDCVDADQTQRDKEREAQRKRRIREEVRDGAIWSAWPSSRR